MKLETRELYQFSNEEINKYFLSKKNTMKAIKLDGEEDKSFSGLFYLFINTFLKTTISCSLLSMKKQEISNAIGKKSDFINKGGKK